MYIDFINLHLYCHMLVQGSAPRNYRATTNWDVCSYRSCLVVRKLPGDYELGCLQLPILLGSAMWTKQ